MSQSHSNSEQTDPVLRALDLYRKALAKKNSGDTPPDPHSFAEGLDEQSTSEFLAQAAYIQLPDSQLPTADYSPEVQLPNSQLTADYTPAENPNAETVTFYAEEPNQDTPEIPDGVTRYYEQALNDENASFVLSPAQQSSESQTQGQRQNKLAGYQILGELGVGGMGVVYKAKQTALNRIVALKMVLAGGRATPSQLARFRGEAIAVAQLDHPNIVKVFDFGESDGLPFIAMEYIDGGALNDLVRHNPLEPRQAAAMMVGIARGMDYAHQHGVIHRDLKPANVLLTKDKSPKVTDFGLAKQMAEEEGETKSGVIMGTPSYMAPEQAEGDTKHVTHLADVYSLGATLYELLTGRPPFQGSSAVAVISQVKSSDPISPTRLSPGLPKDLETICLKCLEKQPTRRYATAGELADELERYLEGRSIIARPIGTTEKFVRWCKRKPTQAGLAVSTAFLAIAFLTSLIAYTIILGQKNTEIAEKNDELKVINTDLEEANDTLIQQNDLTAEQVRYLVRTLAVELRVLGLTKQRDKLVQKVLGTINEMEVLTQNAQGVSDRARVSGWTQIGDLYMELSSADMDQRDKFLVQAATYYTMANNQAERRFMAEPESDLARGNFALTQGLLGDLALARLDITSARDYYTESLRLRQAIVDEPKSQPGTRAYLFPADRLASLAAAQVKLAYLESLEQGDRTAGADHREKALKLHQQAYELAKSDPKTTEEPTGLPVFQRRLAAAYLDQAGSEMAANQIAKAQANLKAAIDLQENAVADNADSLVYQSELANLMLKIGVASLSANKPAQARDYFDRMYSLMDKVVKRSSESDSIANRKKLALSLYGIGLSAAKAGNVKESLNAYRDCVRVRRQLYQEDDRASNAWGLMVALARAGEREKALEIVERETKRDPQFPDYFFNTACVYSILAEQADQAKNMDELQADLTAAMNAVVKLFDFKSQRISDLRSDPDLEFLQKQKEFQKLLDEKLPLQSR